MVVKYNFWVKEIKEKVSLKRGYNTLKDFSGLWK